MATVLQPIHLFRFPYRPSQNAAAAILPSVQLNRDSARIEVMCADSCYSHYDIAAEFHVSRYSVDRHWQNHVTPARKAELIAGPVSIAKLARRAADEDRSLIDYLSILRSELLHLFMDARARGPIADAASVAQRLLNTLDAIGKLTGQLRAGGIVRGRRRAGKMPTASALLFGDFGRLLDEYRWPPGDIFDVPQDGKEGGLAWFIKGSPVVALGRQMAQTQDGRIWRRVN